MDFNETLSLYMYLLSSLNWFFNLVNQNLNCNEFRLIYVFLDYLI